MPIDTEPEDTPVIAAVYRRVSTDRQDNSLDIQEENCARYRRRRGFVLPTGLTFHDNATSGGTPLGEREGGRLLLRAADFGHHPAGAPLALPPVRFTEVIVAKLDRLGRDVLDVIGTIRRFWERGITVHIVDRDWQCSPSPMNEFILTMMAAAAQLERSFIRERTKDSHDKAFNEGRLIGGTIPYGWDAVDASGQPANQENLTHDDGTTTRKWPGDTRLTDNPDEQASILHMAARRREGWSYNRIARELNAGGVPTKSGIVGGWQTGNVKRVLEGRHTRRLLAEHCAVA